AEDGIRDLYVTGVQTVLFRSLPRERRRRRTADLRVTCIAQDARDPRVGVLHVVDRVLLRLLRGERDVDLDRLVRTAVDEVPAREIGRASCRERVESAGVERSG